MTKEGKKFKNVRLFKVSRELNVAVDTLVDHLKQTGHGSALSGSGINASITDEDAYLELLDAFEADKAIASRVREKRAASRTDETGDGVAAAEVETQPTAVEAAPEEPASVVRS